MVFLLSLFVYLDVLLIIRRLYLHYLLVEVTLSPFYCTYQFLELLIKSSLIEAFYLDTEILETKLKFLEMVYFGLYSRFLATKEEQKSKRNKEIDSNNNVNNNPDFQINGVKKLISRIVTSVSIYDNILRGLEVE